VADLTVQVDGYRELIRDFAKTSAEMQVAVKTGLREAADPMRQNAEQLAQEGIRNIGGVWSQMRVGVTQRMVYMQPATRNSGGSPRPNLGGLLMRDAMLPAQAQGRDRAEQLVLALLARIDF